MTQPRTPIWNPVHVRLDGLTPLYASVPANPEVVKAWTDARKPRVAAPGGKSIEAINEEVFASLPEVEETQETLLVFQRHQGHLVMRGATLRAHLKDCARVLSSQYIGRIQGERAFSTRVINGVYLDPKDYWVPVRTPDGGPRATTDGTVDRMVHARGPRGQQLNALKTLEYVTEWRLDYTLLVLGTSVHRSDLETLLTYGGVHGYAGERSMDGGRYTFHLHSEEEA